MNPDEMTLTEFLNRLQAIRREMGCDGKSIGSHDIPSHVRFTDTRGNSYSLKDIDVDMLPGCGCWDGLNLVLEQDDQE